MKCTEPELVWIILLDAMMFVVFVSFVNYIIGFDFFSDLNKYSLLCLIFIYNLIFCFLTRAFPNCINFRLHET